MSFGIVYKSTNIINKKLYIGQTILGLYKRRQIHENCKNNWYFNRAINKYGKENFDWEILTCCDSKEEMDEMEFHYIKQYNSFGKNGYNLTFGGDGVIGYKHSHEHRERMSNLFKGRKSSEITLMKMSKSHSGYKHSEEAKNKMSEYRKGRRLSEEHKRKIASAHKGKKRPPFSNEAIINMSKAKKGKPNLKNRRKYVITFPTGNEYVVTGLSEFCKLYGENYDNNLKLWPKFLSSCAKGKIMTYKKFKCRYYNNDFDTPSWRGEYYG